MGEAQRLGIQVVEVGGDLRGCERKMADIVQVGVFINLITKRYRSMEGSGMYRFIFYILWSLFSHVYGIASGRLSLLLFCFHNILDKEEDVSKLRMLHVSSLPILFFFGMTIRRLFYLCILVYSGKLSCKGSLGEISCYSMDV